MYSTRPVISHLGSEYLPLSTAFFSSVGFGFSSKLPFGRSPVDRGGKKEIGLLKVCKVQSKRKCH